MNSKEADWGTNSDEIKLTPEQIILWLESHLELMSEIWQNNPQLREEWEKINGAR
ncbi:MAG: hypothetical protein IPM57_00595 [Oligoflexia bacterium]|nr:hypothetical protein [Oligoflexia bacterium]